LLRRGLRNILEYAEAVQGVCDLKAGRGVAMHNFGQQAQESRKPPPSRSTNMEAGRDPGQSLLGRTRMHQAEQAAAGAPAS